MQALLLAGGKGTRLKPLTNNLPKPMVPILGEPLLKRTILNLREYGVDEIIISICYQPTQINSYFGNGEKFGINIKYVQEDIPLGTGGAIKNAEKYIDDTFIVLNSDIISDINISALLEYHTNKKGIATIALTEVDDPTQYGVVDLIDGYITTFKEKPKPEQVTSNLINAGIYIFEPEIFNYIQHNQIVSIEKDIYPLLIEKALKITGYHSSYYWMDIGTPEKYMQVHKDILDDKYLITNQLIYSLANGNILQDNNLKIRPSTKIIEPVYIGNNVEIGAKTIVGPYTVIGDNVKISSGSRIVNSIVWDNVVVGKSANITHTIIGSNCKIGNTTEICDSVFVLDADKPVAM